MSTKSFTQFLKGWSLERPVIHKLATLNKAKLSCSKTSQHRTAILLSEWVCFLRTKSHQQAVLLFVFCYKFYNILYSLGNTNTFYSSLPPELLGNLPLLLQVGNHHIHNSSIWKAYFQGVVWPSKTRNNAFEGCNCKNKNIR